MTDQTIKAPAPVGTSVKRIDALEKVTGEALFADDLQFGPGMLFGRIVRSPHPHARIIRIDTSKALELPGVKAVVTGDDTPNQIGLYLKDRHIFCRERVRYVGDPALNNFAIYARCIDGRRREPSPVRITHVWRENGRRHSKTVTLSSPGTYEIETAAEPVNESIEMAAASGVR